MKSIHLFDVMDLTVIFLIIQEVYSLISGVT